MSMNLSGRKQMKVCSPFINIMGYINRTKRVTVNTVLKYIYVILHIFTWQLMHTRARCSTEIIHIIVSVSHFLFKGDWWANFKSNLNFPLFCVMCIDNVTCPLYNIVLLTACCLLLLLFCRQKPTNWGLVRDSCSQHFKSFTLCVMHLKVFY